MTTRSARTAACLQLLGVLVYFVVVSPSTIAAPAPLPSAAQIFADFKSASGGSAWDSVTTITTIAATSNVAGLHGGFENWQDVTDGKYAWGDVHGIVSSYGGCNGSGCWSVDDSGISINADSPEDVWDSACVSYLTSMAYWFPARHGSKIDAVKLVNQNQHFYYSVTLEVEGGLTVELRFDRQTHLLAVTAEYMPTGPFVTAYSDYRKVGGVLLPFTQVTNGDITYKAQTIRLNQTIPPSVFEKPAQRMPDYSFRPDAAGSTTIPFTYRLGEILIPIKINGKGPFDALLDTGGAFITTPNFAKKNGITAYSGMTATGTGPQVIGAGMARVQDVEIGGIDIKNLADLVIPFPLEIPLIGPELFKRFAVKIDFDRSQITLTPLAAFHYTGSGAIIPFTFHGEEPEVSGTLDGISGEFTVDTGQDQPIALFASFVGSNALLKKYSAGSVSITTHGIGGTVPMIAARGLVFTLGTAAAIGPVLNFSSAQSGIFNDQYIAGNLGCPLLHRFNVTFDYAKQQIILEPNSHIAETDPWDGLGVEGHASSRGLIIEEVTPHSPAAIAGIKKGDIITVLNGRKIGENDKLWVYTQEIAPSGTVLSLTVKHKRKSKSFNVTLKEPI
jgi:predicted aspartyl protease